MEVPSVPEGNMDLILTGICNPDGCCVMVLNHTLVKGYSPIDMSITRAST